MPRTGRGGDRQALEGTPISNRTDLLEQPRLTAPHVRDAAAESMATVTALPGAGAGPPPNLMGESWYPDRPVTHGMPTGPGAGPEALGQPVALSPVEKLRRMYRANPNPDLLELLMIAESQGA